MNIIKMPITLVITTVISAFLIASVYSITQPVLEQKQADKLESSFREMYGTNIKSIDLISENNTPDNTAVYQVTKLDDTKEIIFQMQEVGKNGPLKVLLGYDSNNNLSKVQYLEMTETPGIGAKIAEDSYVNTLIGINASDPQVDGISGASISSTAIRTAIENSSELLIGGNYHE
ncbi:MAG: FMN-binding protein [Mycoplasmatales bacterium]